MYDFSIAPPRPLARGMTTRVTRVEEKYFNGGAQEVCEPRDRRHVLSREPAEGVTSPRVFESVLYS